MSYIDQTKIIEIEKQITNDASFLGKLYKSKKNNFQIISVDHNLVDDYTKDGWEILANL